jgi:hypothetical protein
MLIKSRPLPGSLRGKVLFDWSHSINRLEPAYDAVVAHDECACRGAMQMLLAGVVARN